MTNSRFAVALLSSALPCLLLLGCTVRQPEPGAAPLVQLHGRVHGGQQPDTGASIQLYAANINAVAGLSTALLSSPAISDSNGNFSLPNNLSCPTQAATPVYLVATGGNPGLAAGTTNAALVLIAAIGPCSSLNASTFVDIDELTTVAAVYALGTSIVDATHVGGASLTSITASFAYAAQLANTSTGVSPGSSVPSGSFIPTAKLNTLANILSNCVNSDGSGATGNSTPCGMLFTAAAYGGAMPANTLAATIKIAANPTSQAANLFPLAAAVTPFQPALTTAPADWTVAIASLTWTAPVAVSNGVPLGSNQLNASATVPGTFAYSPAAGTMLSAGSHTLSLTFTPADAADYPTLSSSVSLTVNNPSYTWGNVRIVGGGYVDGIVVHPTAANVRYARTDVGGAYSWNQSTGLWVPLTDFYSRANFNAGGCESIALDPSDPQRLYLGMGQYTESYGSNGVFLLSDDQGATFTSVTAPFKMGSNDNGRTAGERFAVDPNLGTILYYGSRNNGLWTSANRGLTWSQVSSFPVTATTGASSAGAGIVFVDFVASSGASGSATPVIYVGVSDTGISGTGYSSLYVSTNAGATWSAVPGQPTGYYPIRGVIGPNAAGPSNILYLAYSNNIGPSGATAGVLYSYVLPPSTNPGGTGTWTNITPGTSARQSGSQGGFASITFDPNNPGVVMATTLDDYYPGDDIYRSINYGASWNSVIIKQGATHNASLSPWVLFGASSITNAGTWPTSLVIDPANSNHIMYGTGQTLWDSSNIQVSDSGGKATFNVGALGIEETVVQALSSPPSGPAIVSGVGDIGGFVNTSISQSPTSGMILSDAISEIVSIDFAQNLPSTFAIAGNSTTGAFSANSGSSWTKFASAPAGTTAGAGAIAVSANGGAFVWAPSDAPVAYTTNNGTTWTASTSAIAKSGVVADRINPNKFYIYSTGTSGSYNGTLQMSTNAGQSFTTAATGLTNYAVLQASYAAEGDLWLGSTTNGLFHSTNSGASFTSVPGFSYVYAIGFGAAAPGGYYPAIYVVGQSSSGVYGFFRSVNEGVTWTQINDSAHQWGYVQPISGDPKLFGRIYLGTGGRGVVYGDSPY